MADPLVIAVVRPAMLGTYGDGGNACVLARRLEWRGQRVSVLPIDHGGVPESADIVLLGGAEDDAQAAMAADSRLVRSLGRAAAAGAVVLGVCAGFQLLGESFVTADGVLHRGVGLLDVVTDRSLPQRATGEVVATATLPDLDTLTGFENHGGCTRLGPDAQPLGRVVAGTGNGDGTEGAVAGNVIGTYLHGPVLARNPALADYVLARKLGPLPPLEIPEVGRWRSERIASALRRGRARTGWLDLLRPRWRRGISACFAPQPTTRPPGRQVSQGGAAVTETAPPPSGASGSNRSTIRR